MIHVGTCGYSYADWKGPFYPPKMQANAMLGFYARRFTAVEIDSTYYRVPPESMFAGLAARAPAGFRFSVKLPATATHGHDAGAPAVHEDVGVLRRNLQPLVDAGSFAAVLMQFPNAFHPGPATRALISALRDELDDIPLVAEFRNSKWQTNDTLVFLRELDIGWVNVDMPAFETLMRPSSDVTSPVAYVRFHGRNAAQWWQGDNVTRYEYTYDAEQLGPWADRLLDLAANPDVREVLAFFNNHRRGQAARDAQLFNAMLRSRYPEAVAVASNEGRDDPEQLSLGL